MRALSTFLESEACIFTALPRTRSRKDDQRSSTNVWFAGAPGRATREAACVAKGFVKRAGARIGFKDKSGRDVASARNAPSQSGD